MKLIIDIPEDYYAVIKETDESKCTLDMLLIKYGNPLVERLQKIRQEITNLVKTYPFIDHKDTYVKEDEVLEIIDKHLSKYSSDHDACLELINDNAELFKKLYDGLKP